MERVFEDYFEECRRRECESDEECAERHMQVTLLPDVIRSRADRRAFRDRFFGENLCVLWRKAFI